MIKVYIIIMAISIGYVLPLLINRQLIINWNRKHSIDYYDEYDVFICIVPVINIIGAFTLIIMNIIEFIKSLIIIDANRFFGRK